MRRAFSLVEMLLVISIVAIVAAISYPIMASAKREAYKTKSISNMRQLWTAIELYRQDQPSALESGLPSQMGLPDSDSFFLELVKKHGLGPPFLGPTRWFHHYQYYPPSEDLAQQDLLDNWVAWSRACTNETVLIADFNFTDREVGPFSGYLSKFGIGIRLNGQIVRKRATGDYATVGWWGCSHTEKKR